MSKTENIIYVRAVEDLIQKAEDLLEELEEFVEENESEGVILGSRLEDKINDFRDSVYYYNKIAEDAEYGY